MDIESNNIILNKDIVIKEFEKLSRMEEKMRKDIEYFNKLYVRLINNYKGINPINYEVLYDNVIKFVIYYDKTWVLRINFVYDKNNYATDIYFSSLENVFKGITLFINSFREIIRLVLDEHVVKILNRIFDERNINTFEERTKSVLTILYDIYTYMLVSLSDYIYRGDYISYDNFYTLIDVKDEFVNVGFNDEIEKIISKIVIDITNMGLNTNTIYGLSPFLNVVVKSILDNINSSLILYYADLRKKNTIRQMPINNFIYDEPIGIVISFPFTFYNEEEDVFDIGIEYSISRIDCDYISNEIYMADIPSFTTFIKEYYMREYEKMYNIMDDFDMS